MRWLSPWHGAFLGHWTALQVLLSCVQGMSVPVVKRALEQQLAKQQAAAKVLAAAGAGAAGGAAAQPAGGAGGMGAAAHAAPDSPAVTGQPSAGAAATGSGPAADLTEQISLSPATATQQQGVSSQLQPSSQTSAPAASPTDAPAAAAPAAETSVSAPDAELAAGTNGGTNSVMTTAAIPDAAGPRAQQAKQQLHQPAAADAEVSSA